MRQADSQFFDTFMLVIGILMGAAVGLFFLARAVSIETQGRYIKADPEVLAEVSKRLEPIGHVMKLGDVEAWGPRVAKGNDTLHMHAIEGFKGDKGFMPPKGGRVDLSDAEISSAVDYIVSQVKK